jgi:hypothetical protein
LAQGEDGEAALLLMILILIVIFPDCDDRSQDQE